MKPRYDPLRVGLLAKRERHVSLYYVFDLRWLMIAVFCYMGNEFFGMSIDEICISIGLELALENGMSAIKVAGWSGFAL